MARTPIHPGEHLAEELEELGVSPDRLPADPRSAESDQPDHQWQTCDFWRYGSPLGTLVRHEPAVLDEPAGPL